MENTGLIWANGGDVTIAGGVTGAGNALISGVASLQFAAASSADTVFAADAASTLILGDSDLFTGVVSGFDGNDSFDFSDIDFAGASLDYVANADGTGGILTVSDGTDTAPIALPGDCDATSFHFAANASGGTLVGYELLV